MTEKQTEIFGGEQQGPALVPFKAYVDKERKLGEIEARATIDAPTGLVNKTAFEDILSNRITEASEQVEDEPTLALIKTDTDGFKKINDTLGHEAGDKYVADLAAALPGWFRPEDAITIIGRVGGDEIDIVLDLKPREIYEAEHQEEVERTKKYSPEERLVAVIERFNECKEAFFATQPEGIQELHRKKIVDLAIGAVLWKPGQDAGELSREADVLLYNAKNSHHTARDELERQEPNFEAESIARAKKMLEDAGRHDLAERLNDS
ncbi:MAG TPA: GGDEF domain-containing protein [Candidatus Saccharimonadales bacterium]|nr:GGDEF domain-containing protein [Candidatus Saccharimonadales bacterium]